MSTLQRMRRAMARLAIFTAPYALAGAPFTVDMKAFESPAVAAEAALTAAAAQPEASRFEYGGAIYRSADGYHFTSPQTSRGSARISISATFPSDAQLVALYHTHPEAEHAELFSADDVFVARELGVPSFILPITSTRIRVFDPLQDRPSTKLGRLLFAAGRPCNEGACR